MSAETLARALSSAPDIIKGVQSGLYTVWGGVVRVAKGNPGGGQIVGHLQFPSDADKASQQIASLQKMLGGAQESLSVLQNLQYANLALSGLNLAVSIVGFAIVCKKLNGISVQLQQQSEKLDQLLEMASNAKAREELQDNARFRAALKTVRQFADQGDLDGLKSQVGNLHEQYEITKLTLIQAINVVGKDKGFVESLDMLKNLQQRMMYLGFLQSYVQQHTASEKYAIETLRELQEDWLQINTVVIESIAANEEWVEHLTQKEGDNIISFLEYRKTVAPAIEYQASLLAFAAKNPQLIAMLNEDVSEIRFLAA